MRPPSARMQGCSSERVADLPEVSFLTISVWRSPDFESPLLRQSRSHRLPRCSLRSRSGPRHARRARRRRLRAAPRGSGPLLTYAARRGGVEVSGRRASRQIRPSPPARVEQRAGYQAAASGSWLGSREALPSAAHAPTFEGRWPTPKQSLRSAWKPTGPRRSKAHGAQPTRWKAWGQGGDHRLPRPRLVRPRLRRGLCNRMRPPPEIRHRRRSRETPTNPDIRKRTRRRKLASGRSRGGLVSGQHFRGGSLLPLPEHRHHRPVFDSVI